MMEVDPQWDEDDRFVAYTDLPTLQTMASYSFARAIVFNFISHLPKITLSETYKLHRQLRRNLDDHYSEFIASKKLPRPIQEIIRECLVQVRCNLINYDDLLRCKCSSSKNTIEFNPEYFVWLANGEIDREQSAVKMLSIDGLSDVHKFKLLSEFCMENQLATFDVSTLPEEFVKSCTFDENCTSFYWLCYLKNELEKVRSSYHDNDSVDKKMAKECSSWSAFLYFWNRLNDKDQTSVAIDLLTKSYSVHIDKMKIFSMMSSDQQHELLSRIPDVLIRNSSEYSDSPRFILWVWKHSKSSMTKKKFSRIILALLRGKLHIEDRMDTLIEIWNNAADQLKHYVANDEDVPRRVLKVFLPVYEGEYTSERYGCGWYLSTSSESVIRDFTPCPTAFRFLRLLVLQHVEEHRIWFLLGGARGFAGHIGDPRPFEEIFQLVCGDEDRQKSFKAFVTSLDDMRNSCDHLIGNNQCDVLRTKLKFYLPDEESFLKYLKYIFQNPGNTWTRNYMYDSKWWEIFTKAMEKLLPDPAQASQMIKLFVKSSASALVSSTLTDELLESVQKITKSVLSKKQLVAFKKSLAKALAKSVKTQGHRYTEGEKCWSNAKNFIDWAKWCCNSHPKSIQYFQTKILPVDVIVNTIFEFINDRYFRNYSYEYDMMDVLDEYLKWYMPNDEERKAYKIQRVNKPNELLIFDCLVDHPRNQYSNESWQFLEELIYWGCEEDQKVIDEFEAKYPKYVRPTVDSKK